METATKWLEAHGAEYRRKRIQLTDIDRDKSLHNQARVSAPLNEDAVILYAVAYEAGAEFPPIITYVNGNGKHVIIDGNHRVEAADMAGITALDAYVVTNPTPGMIQALTYEANTKHGLPTSIGERVQQALHLEASGMPRSDAAKALGVPEHRLESAATLARVDVRIYRLRRNISDIPVSNRKRLDAIRSDNVLAAALELVTSSKMSTTEVSDLVSKINRHPNESDQMLEVQREIGRQSTKIAATAGGKINLPEPIVALNRAMAAVDRLDVEAIQKAWPVIGEQMKMVYLAKVMDAQRRIRELLQ